MGQQVAKNLGYISDCYLKFLIFGARPLLSLVFFISKQFVHAYSKDLLYTCHIMYSKYYA